MNDKDAREKYLRERHLRFAEGVYRSTFDESKMTENEIKNRRAQIPTLGIVPFDCGFDAGEEYALEGPAVTALVEALKVVAVNGEGRGMGWTPAQHARQALEDFRKARGNV